jgi:hypothetical protein
MNAILIEAAMHSPLEAFSSYISRVLNIPASYIPATSAPLAFTASPVALFPNPFAFTARSGIALVDWCSVTIIAPAGFLPWH